jgi:AcrR family transcriptional regulator
MPPAAPRSGPPVAPLARSAPARGTRECILVAAEQLFAAHGFNGTSLRSVTSLAGVNLAAVHYHFGSKEALLHAVAARRIEPINRERLAALDRIEAAAHPRPPEPRAVIEAYLAPAVRAGEEGAMRAIVGRLYGEPPDLVQRLLRELFGEVTRRFTAALARGLPELSEGEVLWRYLFVVGVLTHVISGSPQRAPAPPELLESCDNDTLLARMIEFALGGLRAPGERAR